MIAGKLNIVIDGQWGSTGKGKVASYLAHKYKLSLAVCNFAPNAGHTHYTKTGRKVILKQLPSSLLNEDVDLALGPTAIIDKKRLLQEIEEHSVGKRVFVDKKAVVISDEDLKREEDLEYISSTKQGGGSALARKVLRRARLAGETPELHPFITDVVSIIHRRLAVGELVLAESAQGFDLSLNHGHHYPFTTSRDMTTSSIASDFGCPPGLVGDVYGVLRPYPIRVGNVIKDGVRCGWSGPHYEDQEELTWGFIEKEAGFEAGTLKELTTVTGKVRRVFSWSDLQFDRFMRYCAPTKLCFNHLDYLDCSNRGRRNVDYLSGKTLKWIHSLIWKWKDRKWLTKNNKHGLVHWVGSTISLLGTGPKLPEMIDMEKERTIWTL